MLGNPPSRASHRIFHRLRAGQGSICTGPYRSHGRPKPVLWAYLAHIVCAICRLLSRRGASSTGQFTILTCQVQVVCPSVGSRETRIRAPPPARRCQLTAEIPCVRCTVPNYTCTYRTNQRKSCTRAGTFPQDPHSGVKTAMLATQKLVQSPVLDCVDTSLG
jgi:hypothetical protein